MNRKQPAKIFLLSCIFSVSVLAATAQAKPDDMAAITNHIQGRMAAENVKQKSSARILKTYNPIKLLLYMPLYGYQRFISEQLSASCTFEPSCSAFSILAIKKLGFIKGLFMTADRLTRCNGTAQYESEFYLYDPKKSKVIDDPSMYRFK